MAWDNNKSTASDPDNPNADEQLTASEWNTHVDEGHWPSGELQFQIDNGDPVLVDPQNSNEIVARYDRSEGSWVIDTLEAGELSSDIENPNEVTSSRSFNTVYQNTTNHLLIVSVVLESDGTQDIIAGLRTGSDSSLGLNYEIDRVRVDAEDISSFTDPSLRCIVEAGDYYRVAQLGSSTIRNWYERGMV